MEAVVFNNQSRPKLFDEFFGKMGEMKKEIKEEQLSLVHKDQDLEERMGKVEKRFNEFHIELRQNDQRFDLLLEDMNQTRQNMDKVTSQFNQ